jgi:hypothetical protein
MSTTPVVEDRLPSEQRHELPDSRRADPGRLQREIRIVSESPIVTALLESVDASLLVLNSERQIVAHNGRILAGEPTAILGLRPAEALGCTNARGEGGCGATPACRTCGTLGAILGCKRQGRPVEAECVIPSELFPGRELEFHVRATPVTVEGIRFTVLSLRDVSAEKRREALEQTFFHDILNTVAGLAGWAEQLRQPGADSARASERIEILARRLEREIRDQRALQLAEAGELVPSLAPLRASDLAAELRVAFSSHPLARRRRLTVDEPPLDLELETDPTLLLRVLTNMVCNALEATAEGGEVRVWCERCPARARADPPEPRAVRFLVHNEGAMPLEVQERVFERSFSTKTRGRGLGTYGMKLFGEGYLGGEVSFTSTAEAGTTFSVSLPRRS